MTTHSGLHAAIIGFFAGTMLLGASGTLNAAYGYNGYPVYQVRQNVWRPTVQAPRVMANGYSWRPIREAQPRRLRDLRPNQQRWARSARPLTRGGDLATQFRPDHRFDEPVVQGGVVSDQDSDLHAQFRPVQPPIRRTYEELYQPEPIPQPLPQQPMAPVMPYLPPPMPVVPYWGYWQ